jgi:hypothetical protein
MHRNAPVKHTTVPIGAHKPPERRRTYRCQSEVACSMRRTSSASPFYFLFVFAATRAIPTCESQARQWNSARANDTPDAVPSTRFVPNTRKAKREAIIAAATSFVAAPLYFWWKGFFSVGAAIAITLFAFAVLSARAFYMLSIRGLDTMTLDDAGVHLSRRRASDTFAWTEIHKVYRFGELLVFESVAPHRRYNFSLEGHEDHLKEIVAALGERARTMDLRWLDELT